MSTAKIIALILFVVSVVLFLAVGLNIMTSSEYNLVALGLASFVTGHILFHYVP